MNRRPPQPRNRAALDATLRKRPVRNALNRNRKKPDVLRALRYAAVLLLIGQCLRVAFTSPRLQLREVRVTGSRRFTPQQVTRLGRISLGQNVFRVNLGQVSGRLEAMPVIREAIVTRELPATLNIEIRERAPAIRVEAGGESVHADAEGVVFERAATAPGRFPRLELEPGQLPALGRRLPADLVRTVKECARLAREERLALLKMRVDGSGELWLNVGVHPGAQTPPGDGLSVRVGRWTELPSKFHDIRQVLTGWPDLTAKAAYLNVMCAGRPAYLRSADDASSRSKRIEN